MPLGVWLYASRFVRHLPAGVFVAICQQGCKVTHAIRNEVPWQEGGPMAGEVKSHGSRVRSHASMGEATCWLQQDQSTSTCSS